MPVGIKLSALRESQWHEYAIRFLVGGLATATAGFIAKLYGPAVGGLFLAFPAIFPASATLVDKHERERKEEAGLRGSRRGRDVAALEASGAAIGSFGLMAFGAVVWLFIPLTTWFGFALAGAAWATVSLLLWAGRRNFRLARMTPKVARN